jgi:hypothetical protein
MYGRIGNWEGTVDISSNGSYKKGEVGEVHKHVVRVAVTPPVVVRAVAGRSTSTCLLYVSCTLIPVIRQGVGFLIQLLSILWSRSILFQL